MKSNNKIGHFAQPSPPKQQSDDKEAQHTSSTPPQTDRLDRYQQSSHHLSRLSTRSSQHGAETHNPRSLFDPRFVYISCKINQDLQKLSAEDKKQCLSFFELKRDGLSTEEACEKILGEDDIGSHDDLLRNVHDILHPVINDPLYGETVQAYSGVGPEDLVEWDEEGRV